VAQEGGFRVSEINTFSVLFFGFSVNPKPSSDPYRFRRILTRGEHRSKKTSNKRCETPPASSLLLQKSPPALKRQTDMLCQGLPVIRSSCEESRPFAVVIHGVVPSHTFPQQCKARQPVRKVLFPELVGIDAVPYRRVRHAVG